MYNKFVHATAVMLEISLCSNFEKNKQACNYLKAP